MYLDIGQSLHTQVGGRILEDIWGGVKTHKHTSTHLKPPLKALKLLQSLPEAFGQSSTCQMTNSTAVLTGLKPFSLWQLSITHKNTVHLQHKYVK